jgi:hypothetical protein
MIFRMIDLVGIVYIQIEHQHAQLFDYTVDPERVSPHPLHATSEHATLLKDQPIRLYIVDKTSSTEIHSLKSCLFD